jgi:CheY-like chemotaxis protein
MLHFLLIDDNAERRTRLSNLLRKEGAVVSEAETVAQGIEFSRRTGIDAFLIDTCAAEIDGRRALDLVRREGIEAPVVLLADRWDERLYAQLEAKGGQLLKKTAQPKLLVDACCGAMAV